MLWTQCRHRMASLCLTRTKSSLRVSPLGFAWEGMAAVAAPASAFFDAVRVSFVGFAAGGGRLTAAVALLPSPFAFTIVCRQGKYTFRVAQDTLLQDQRAGCGT